MSHFANEQWVENAHEIFDEALSQQEWEMALAVIADCNANGNESAAIILKRELQKAQKEALHGRRHVEAGVYLN